MILHQIAPSLTSATFLLTHLCAVYAAFVVMFVGAHVELCVHRVHFLFNRLFSKHTLVYVSSPMIEFNRLFSKHTLVYVSSPTIEILVITGASVFTD